MTDPGSVTALFAGGAVVAALYLWLLWASVRQLAGDYGAHALYRSTHGLNSLSRNRSRSRTYLSG